MIQWHESDDLGSFHIRVLQRSKTHVKIRVVSATLIEVSAPKHLGRKRIQDTLQQNQAWIRAKRLQALKQTDVEAIWFLGEQLPVEHHTLADGTPTLYLTHPLIGTHQFSSKPLIHVFLRQQALERVLPRLQTLLQPAYPHVTAQLSIARSYWGICRPQQIKLNWRLIGAPAHIIDYVCWHEICHLTHPNHSPQFWHLVEEVYPHHRAAKTWLRQHGSALMAVDLLM